VSAGRAATGGERLGEARGALLTNFVAPYRVPLFQLLAREFGAFKVFVSTPMEPNRAWRPDWGDLDVAVLPALTLNRTVRHPHDFSEPLFVHLPYTVLFHLWRFRPDVVISGQLGLASALAAIYCALRSGAVLVLWLTLSEVSELGRGRIRRRLRRWLLARADAVMVNGESGARYARSFGTPDAKIVRVQQAVDVAAFSGRGDRERETGQRLLFVGSGEPRKGLRPFVSQLARWAESRPERPVELWVAGTGAECLGAAPPALPDNLRVRWIGHVPYEGMPEIYAEAGILAFPTLADEWGLVVNEAMAAGVPVLGSRYSQAVEELVEDARTGWTFRPDRADECLAAIDRALATPPEELARMRAACRERIAALTFEVVAERMLGAIASARARREAHRS
jgi:glycosyltransferase involved in cell wall biosynthesis